MSRIIVIGLLLGGIVFWWHWQNTPDPVQRKKLLQKTLIGVLIVVTVLLVAAGRMHWLGAVLAGALAFLKQGLTLLLRFFPVLTHLYRTHASASKAPNSSSVSARMVEMTLNHDSGKLSGRVLEGEFKGRSLDEMSREDLSVLLDYCKLNDADSARLLESYLSGRFGDAAGAQSRTVATSEMSVEEALQVMGLKGTPSKQDITEAYRKIMQKLHPDRGGNEYFAAKVNQAREILTDRFG